MIKGDSIYSYSNFNNFKIEIDFDKTWKDHAVTAIAGLEFRENKIPINISYMGILLLLLFTEIKINLMKL